MQAQVNLTQKVDGSEMVEESGRGEQADVVEEQKVWKVEKKTVRLSGPHSCAQVCLFPCP